MNVFGRTRLVAAALFNKAIETVVLAKISAFPTGAPNRLDRWVLNRIHQMMVRQIERMRLAAGEEEHRVSELPDAGVHNAEVVLRASNQAWSTEASRETDAIRQALGDSVAVHHIGSTAVAQLAAKPIIDLAVALPAERFEEELTRANAVLVRLGYRYVGVRGGYFFEKGPAPVRTHALQVHAADSGVLVDLLRFRDALRQNEALRKDYAATKAALAAHFPRQRLLYVTYKFHWIAEWQWREADARCWTEWFVGHKRTQIRLTKAWRPTTG